ncbi:hypothetical protein HK104_006263 [Borealophlyctis nickersoniae]|nr:hypothetical protein HK104_006263 [Borealophlyctis nickersoniae]
MMLFHLPTTAPVLTLNYGLTFDATTGFDGTQLQRAAERINMFLRERRYRGYQLRLAPRDHEGAGQSVDGRPLTPAITEMWVVLATLDRKSWVRDQRRRLEDDVSRVSAAIEGYGRAALERYRRWKAGAESTNRLLRRQLPLPPPSKLKGSSATYPTAGVVTTVCTFTIHPDQYLPTLAGQLPVATGPEPYKYHPLLDLVNTRRLLLVPGPPVLPIPGNAFQDHSYHLRNVDIQDDPLFWRSLNALLLFVRQQTQMEPHQWVELIYFNHGTYESANKGRDVGVGAMDEGHAHASVLVHADMVRVLADNAALGMDSFRGNIIDPEYYLKDDVEALLGESGISLEEKRGRVARTLRTVKSHLTLRKE